jgi:hypothetical protein
VHLAGDGVEIDLRERGDRAEALAEAARDEERRGYVGLH